MLTPPGRLAPGRWRFRMRPPLRPGASQPTLWPHPSPKPHPRPPRALPVPSAVHRPSTVHRHRPRSSPPSAVCGPPSAVHIRLFVPHSLTVSLRPHRKPILRPPLSAVRRPHVHIRSFVPHSLTVCHPPNSIESPSSAACRPPSIRRPRSAVHIRLFVPHSLTVCPPPRSLESPSSAICRPPSTFVYSFPIR
jgi:hypothetical protein